MHMFERDPQVYFPSVPDSMSTLLLRGTLPDLADIVEDVGAEHPIYAVIMLLGLIFHSKADAGKLN